MAYIPVYNQKNTSFTGTNVNMSTGHVSMTGTNTSKVTPHEPLHGNMFEISILLESEADLVYGADLVNEITDHNMPSTSQLTEFEYEIVSMKDCVLNLNATVGVLKITRDLISRLTPIRICTKFHDKTGAVYMKITRKNCILTEANFIDGDYRSTDLKSLTIKYKYSEQKIEFND